MNARKTEYRGIVFGSKAEARLALLLDDQGKNWWYEPESLKLMDGYVPDFLIIGMDRLGDVISCSTNSRIMVDIVEYKPKRPTTTYIKELAIRFNEIGDILFAEKTLDMMSGCAVNYGFHLLVGGMGYEKPESLVMSWCGPGTTMWIQRTWKNSWDGVFGDIDIETKNKRLKNYRFDLIH